MSHCVTVVLINETFRGFRVRRCGTYQCHEVIKAAGVSIKPKGLTGLHLLTLSAEARSQWPRDWPLDDLEVPAQ